ncbi:MAG: hypothetical protein RSB76_03085 [Clostridia bacterium]
MHESREEIEFLEYIYQNVKMCQESSGRIIRINTLDKKMFIILKDTINEYKKIATSAKAMLLRRKKDAIDIGIISKFATYINVKLNMSKIDEKVQIAKILIQNSNVVTEQIIDKINDYKIKNKAVLSLAKRFIDIENRNVVNFKVYIKDTN